jgi:hypothetical protein
MGMVVVVSSIDLNLESQTGVEVGDGLVAEEELLWDHSIGMVVLWDALVTGLGLGPKVTQLRPTWRPLWVPHTLDLGEAVGVLVETARIAQ